MPRHDDRYGGNTRLYVGHLSSRTRSRDLEHVFSRYGRNSVIQGMLMMLDITWMEEMLMDDASLLNLPREYHVDLEEFENMLEKVLLQVLDGASIVALMAIGLEIARLETGKISVIAVGKEVILRRTARKALRSRVNVVAVIHALLGGHVLLDVAGVGAEVSAEAAATAGQGPLLEEAVRLSTMKGDQEVLQTKVPYPNGNGLLLPPSIGSAAQPLLGMIVQVREGALLRGEAELKLSKMTGIMKVLRRLAKALGTLPQGGTMKAPMQPMVGAEAQVQEMTAALSMTMTMILFALLEAVSLHEIVEKASDGLISSCMPILYFQCTVVEMFEVPENFLSLI